MERDLVVKSNDALAVVTVTDVRGDLSSRAVMQIEQLEQLLRDTEVTEV